MTNPDISTWLTEIGLENQVQLFTDNRIDFDVLADLNEADLRELGLPLGDRKRLLKAIESLASESPAEATTDVPAGERRQVAVLFADISGFTTLAAERDAEEIHELLNRFFTAVDVVVQSFGGSIDKHIGDEVMAVFGAPVAHTDDPERAVRAALALHDAAAELEPPMRIHVGVAAGQVVASATGSAAHQEYTVTGDTVNLASRLTDLARAGETLISASVQDELDDRLDDENLGAQSLPGLPEPVPVWRVNGMAEAREYAAGSFIGRAAEIEIFQDALDTTLRDGRGLTLFVRGEAGIGKTRLLHEFQRLARDAGFHHHGGQVLDFGVGEGQDAIPVLLRDLLDLTPGAGPNQRTAAAHAATETGLIGPEQRLHLNDLLSLPRNAAEAVLYEAMDNEQRNRGRVDALLTLVKGLSKQAPLLLGIEDLHWAQPALLDYLTALAAAAGEHRILLLLSSRVQGDPLDAAWYEGIAPSSARIVDLKPLTGDEAQDFILDFEGVDRERAAACLERSGGNPLFLEQLLRSPGGDDGAIIPGSVQSVVQARIDALPSRDRTALQAASVLGQRFALDAMCHLMNDNAYQPDNLLHLNMIRRSEGAFQFYHALFRDAVHGSFLKERRQNLHLRAADWFQNRDAVLYAEHLGEAESDRAAIAFERAARAEAAAYRIDRALELVDRGLGALPAGGDPFELTAYRAYLLRELGRPGDALAAWRAALELATSDSQRCPAWIGIAAANRLMGQGDKAMDELDQAEAVARREGLEKELAEIYFYRGNMAFAAGRFEDCLELHNQTLHHARAAHDPEWEASAQGGLLDAEYARGHMRSALANLDRCLALCREHGLLHIEARNRFMAGTVGRYLHQQSAAIKELEAASALSDSIQDVRGAMYAHLINGEILIDMAQYADAQSPLQQALSITRSVGNRRMELYTLYEMARCAMGQDNRSLAQERLAEAMDIGHDTGIVFHGPRLFALRSRLTGGVDECREWLAKGDALVRAGANAHNVLWFHRDAIDACLAVGDLERARAHGDALTAFTAEGPLPWVNFFAARCHALANSAAGRSDEAALRQVCDQGRELELNIALPELEAQLI